MKQWLLLFVAIAVCVASCKKDGGASPHYYIRAMINGAEKSFENNTVAAEYSGDWSAGFSMNANNTAEHTSFYLGITHPFGVTVKEGVYNNQSGYFLPGSNYTLSDTVIYGSGTPGVSTLQLTISHLTNQTVSGTFSGRYYQTYGASDSVDVANGEFYLPVGH